MINVDGWRYALANTKSINGCGSLFWKGFSVDLSAWVWCSAGYGGSSYKSTWNSLFDCKTFLEEVSSLLLGNGATSCFLGSTRGMTLDLFSSLFLVLLPFLIAWVALQWTFWNDVLHLWNLKSGRNLNNEKALEMVSSYAESRILDVKHGKT